MEKDNTPQFVSIGELTEVVQLEASGRTPEPAVLHGAIALMGYNDASIEQYMAKYPKDSAAQLIVGAMAVSSFSHDFKRETLCYTALTVNGSVHVPDNGRKLVLRRLQRVEKNLFSMEFHGHGLARLSEQVYDLRVACRRTLPHPTQGQMARKLAHQTEIAVSLFSADRHYLDIATSRTALG